MAGREHVNAVLADYARLLGMRGLALDEDGQCQLQFGDEVYVAFGLADNGGHLVLAAPLGEVPGSLKEEIQAEMLDANYLWQGTAGVTLAIERESAVAVACVAMPAAGLTAERLESDIDRLVAVAEDWMTRLRGAKAGQPVARDAMIRM
ncbi:MAG TPA: type III secretion system chaperone [Geminicoccaceae bacterium]|nr:type III secretion system chaperone [Geminicoccus sp.]HMU52199.1 type III secretion system chaperone [Geminicoccaceae bacterium]